MEIRSTGGDSPPLRFRRRRREIERRKTSIRRTSPEAQPPRHGLELPRDPFVRDQPFVGARREVGAEQRVRRKRRRIHRRRRRREAIADADVDVASVAAFREGLPFLAHPRLRRRNGRGQGVQEAVSSAAVVFGGGGDGPRRPGGRGRRHRISFFQRRRPTPRPNREEE